ncbi:hypothetical protein AJ87_12040 [Rhizobium yanglingense]|nr:hypothetical protein AJ87_12040 [Rhizobium yanglingense]
MNVRGLMDGLIYDLQIHTVGGIIAAGAVGGPQERHRAIDLGGVAIGRRIDLAKCDRQVCQLRRPDLSILVASGDYHSGAPWWRSVIDSQGLLGGRDGTFAASISKVWMGRCRDHWHFAIVSTLKLYLHDHVMRPSPRAGAFLRDRDARRQRAFTR